MSEPSSHIPFAVAGSYPVRAGNLVHPLVDGEPAFRRICEAVESARHGVWVTVAFIRPGFLMPDGRGSFFDALDDAVERGLDVRVIFWRPNSEASYVDEGSVFAGTQADRDFLRSRGSRIRIRWDRAHGAFCQHQKSWVVDAGHPSEIAFVGGININPRAMVAPGHVGGGGIHDAYVEIAGPAATDVHHNFVQRWNEASERAAGDGVWGQHGDSDLTFPNAHSEVRGRSLVQIQRNIHAGLYSDGRATPGGRLFEIVDGESTIREQYLAAIDAARRSIYIENQALSVVVVVDCLLRALVRGVEIVLLLPAEPESWVGAARQTPEHRSFFDKFSALGQHENFTLVGIAGRDEAGMQKNVYVHAKLMLIDDAWATMGSCNLHRNSLFGHSELNAAVWDPDVVRSLRYSLLAEHLGEDTGPLDDRAALRRYRQVAEANRQRRDKGLADWQGLAFTLDPASYGV